MPQPDHISKLGVPARSEMDDDLQQVFVKGVDKLGYVPNVLASYSLRPQRLRNFMSIYNEIMLSSSGLSRLEREMVAVVVSSVNRCYYCLVAHGAAVRQLSGDPELGEMLSLNYRVAQLDPRQRLMLDFAWKLTATPHLVDDSDRDALSQQGLSQEDIFDLSETVAFFNLSNRMASALEIMPNREYHKAKRVEEDNTER
jgi:uncharacterized peroxidase-related enzyme